MLKNKFQSMLQLPPAIWAMASLAVHAASKASSSSPEQPSQVVVVVSPAISQVQVVSWLQEVRQIMSPNRAREGKYFM